MRLLAAGMFLASLLAVASFSEGTTAGRREREEGQRRPCGGPGGKGGKTATVEEMVARLMAFDKNGDGKLTKEELTDTRLHAMFDRADANMDGVVTKEELTSLLTKEAARWRTAAADRGDKGGKGGPGGKRRQSAPPVWEAADKGPPPKQPE